MDAESLNQTKHTQSGTLGVSEPGRHEQIPAGPEGRTPGCVPRHPKPRQRHPSQAQTKPWWELLTGRVQARGAAGAPTQPAPRAPTASPPVGRRTLPEVRCAAFPGGTRGSSAQANTQREATAAQHGGPTGRLTAHAPLSPKKPPLSELPASFSKCCSCKQLTQILSLN